MEGVTSVSCCVSSLHTTSQSFFAGADDPLTLADSSSHKEMVMGFQQTWPELHVVSEEVGANQISTYSILII